MPVECLFSITPLSGLPRGRRVPEDVHSNRDRSAGEEEAEEEIRRRSSTCSE